jgi:hypothetical protein
MAEGFGSAQGNSTPLEQGKNRLVKPKGKKKKKGGRK